VLGVFCDFRAFFGFWQKQFSREFGTAMTELWGNFSSWKNGQMVQNSQLLSPHKQTQTRLSSVRISTHQAGQFRQAVLYQVDYHN